MRFKMVSPLAKARRISNSLTRPVKQLFSGLSIGESQIEYKNISVLWADGLPDDPRENVEICKLATGATKMMPLEEGIMEFFQRSNEEAKRWLEQIRAETEESMQLQQQLQDPNKPGPQDGTGVNPTKKGSTTGLNDFHGTQNQ